MKTYSALHASACEHSSRHASRVVSLSRKSCADLLFACPNRFATFGFATSPKTLGKDAEKGG